MGIGSPRRFTRDALGPKLRENYPVENPETDIPAASLNALFHQAAASSLILPRVSLIAEWNSGASDFTVFQQEEAWNALHEQAHPVLVRSSTGLYVYTFAPTYLDEDEAAVNLALVGVRGNAIKTIAAFSDRVELHACFDNANPLQIQIRIFRSGTGALEDARFWLEVF